MVAEADDDTDGKPVAGGGLSADPSVDIRVLRETADVERATMLFQQVWGTALPIVATELLRAIGHAGGYVVGAYDKEQLVGASFGFLGRYRGTESLHSHATGILPGLQRSGVGRAIKHHQRLWAAEHNIAWITWTFDPLVRRNGWFNIVTLGCEVAEYLTDFYGAMDDSINGLDESDRLLVAWPTSGAANRSEPIPSNATIKVPTPNDIVTLRRTDPQGADEWRRRLRVELGDRINSGATVVGFDRYGNYLLDGAT